MIRAADAAQERLVTGGGGSVDVDELPCGIANELNELGRGGFGGVSGMRLLGLLRGLLRGSDVGPDQRRGRDRTAQQCQTQETRVEFLDKGLYCRHRLPSLNVSIRSYFPAPDAYNW